MGQLIKHLYENEKIRQVIIGSGGSAFCDGGLGAIHALDVFEIGLRNGAVIGREEVPLAKHIE